MLLDYHIVDVYLNYLTHVILEYGIHYFLIGRSHIFFTEGHYRVAVQTFVSDKRYMYLVYLVHMGLIVSINTSRKDRHWYPEFTSTGDLR